MAPTNDHERRTTDALREEERGIETAAELAQAILAKPFGLETLIELLWKTRSPESYQQHVYDWRAGGALPAGSVPGLERDWFELKAHWRPSEEELAACAHQDSRRWLEEACKFNVALAAIEMRNSRGGVVVVGLDERRAMQWVQVFDDEEPEPERSLWQALFKPVELPKRLGGGRGRAWYDERGSATVMRWLPGEGEEKLDWLDIKSRWLFGKRRVMAIVVKPARAEADAVALERFVLKGNQGYHKVADHPPYPCRMRGDQGSGGWVGRWSPHDLEHPDFRELYLQHLSQTYGRYTRGDLIDTGGFGAVYKAYCADGRGTRLVALKELHDQHHLDPDANARARTIARFERERRALRAIEHRNVVRYVDEGLDLHGRPFVVMEYVDGPSLASYVESWRSVHEHVPVSCALRAVIAILEGLEAVHQAGYVHRDVQPHNVLVEPYPGATTFSGATFKLTDFGFASYLPEWQRSRMTQLKTSYSAPEVLVGNRHGPSADVFSAGKLLYFLLTGAEPFYFNATAEGLRRARPDVPDAAVDVFVKSTATQASDRYQAAAEMAAALADALADVTQVEELSDAVASRAGSGDWGDIVERGEDLLRLAPRLTAPRTAVAGALVACASSHRAFGRNAEAIRFGKMAVRLADDLAPARYELGMTLRTIGRLNEACVELEQASRLAPESVPFAGIAALARLEHGEVVPFGSFVVGPWRAATANDRTALAGPFVDAAVRLADTDDPSRACLLARAFENDTDAIDSTRTAGFARACVRIGVAMREASHIEDALSVLRVAVRVDPSVADARAELGKTLWKSGQSEAAVEELRAAAAIDSASNLHQLAEVQRALGHFEGALAALWQAHGVGDGRARLTLLSMVKQLASRAELVPRLVVWSRGLGPDIDPASPLLKSVVSTIQREARAHGSAGRWDVAFALIRCALSLAPDNTSLILLEAGALLESGRHRDALAALDRLPRKRNDAAAREEEVRVRVLALASLGSYDRADSVLVAAGPDARAARPAWSAFQHEAISRAAKAGDWAKVLDLATRLLRNPAAPPATPAIILAVQGAAGAFLEQGRTSEAVQAAGLSVALEPGAAAAHSMLAMCLRAANDIPRALTAIERAIELEPESPRLRSFRAELAQAAGQRHGMIDAYREAWRLGDVQALQRAAAAIDGLVASASTPAAWEQVLDRIAGFIDAGRKHSRDMTDLRPTVLGMLRAAAFRAGQPALARAGDLALQAGVDPVEVQVIRAEGCSKRGRLDEAREIAVAAAGMASSAAPMPDICSRLASLLQALLPPDDAWPPLLAVAAVDDAVGASLPRVLGATLATPNPGAAVAMAAKWAVEGVAAEHRDEAATLLASAAEQAMAAGAGQSAVDLANAGNLLSPSNPEAVYQLAKATRSPEAVYRARVILTNRATDAAGTVEEARRAYQLGDIQLMQGNLIEAERKLVFARDRGYRPAASLLRKVQLQLAGLDPPDPALTLPRSGSQAPPALGLAPLWSAVRRNGWKAGLAVLVAGLAAAGARWVLMRDQPRPERAPHAPAPSSAPPSDALTGRMLHIRGGTFTFGSDSPESQGVPAHLVTVGEFDIDAVEVTVEAYSQCVHAKGCREPQRTEPRCNWKVRPEQPMNCVDYGEAEAFCTWAGKSLPAEEEWELAARGFAANSYPWGVGSPDGRACWRTDGTCRPGGREGGASPFGVKDLAGSVWEWTSSSICPEGLAGCNSARRSCRGGSWAETDPRYLLAYFRAACGQSVRSSNLGFRCVRRASGVAPRHSPPTRDAGHAEPAPVDSAFELGAAPPGP